MKYSEFETEVEKMGFFLDAGEHGIEIVDKYGIEYAYSSKESEMIVDTAYENFPKLPQEQRAALFDLLYVISKTPLAEREEEKRYWLLSVSPMLRKSECGYLLYHKSMGRYFTGSAEYGGDVYQAIFTESEIAQMDITGFEKIEVSND